MRLVPSPRASHLSPISASDAGHIPARVSPSLIRATKDGYCTTSKNTIVNGCAEESLLILAGAEPTFLPSLRSGCKEAVPCNRSQEGANDRGPAHLPIVGPEYPMALDTLNTASIKGTRNSSILSEDYRVEGADMLIPAITRSSKLITAVR